MHWQSLWNMLAFLFFIGTAMASSQTERQIADYITKLETNDIQQIVICQDDDCSTDIFADSTYKEDGLLSPLVIVTNRLTVGSLVADLRKMLSERVPLEDMPFSGILAYQVFVTKQEVFLVTHVFLGEEGIVAASICRRQNDGFCLVSGDMILVKAPFFSKTIQCLMEKFDKDGMSTHKGEQGACRSIRTNGIRGKRNEKATDKP
jgi:hypothetical protein